MPEIDPSPEAVKKSHKLREKGNELIKKGKYKRALDAYLKAIELNKKSEVLYSNCAFTRTKLKQFKKALKDVNTSIKIKPLWYKSHYRRGLILADLELYSDANESFNEAIRLTRIDKDFETMEKIKKQVVNLDERYQANLKKIQKLSDQKIKTTNPQLGTAS